MNIKKNDLVLEIGSGDKPYCRSDILLDAYPCDSREREQGKPLIIDRPLVIARGEALPFANDSFGYIIASHVLEHAHSPGQFLDELSRVGKAGYIETPLPLRERVFDWSFHRWYVYQEKGCLILVRKTKKSKGFFGGLSGKKREKLQLLEGKRLKNLKFEWKKPIAYQILNSEPDGFLESLDKKLTDYLVEVGNFYAPVLIKWKILLKGRLYRIKESLLNVLNGESGKNKKQEVDLLSLLVCPRCKNKLIVNKKLVCLRCRRQFPLVEGKIPQFLP